MTFKLNSVMAAALAVAIAAAQPARADNLDARHLLLGLAGVAVLATVLDQAGRPKATTPTRQQHVRQYADTRRCLRQRWVRGTWQRYMSQRCLKRLERRGLLPYGTAAHYQQDRGPRLRIGVHRTFR